MPATVLSELVGVDADWLEKFLIGRFKTIEFDRADALLCKTGMFLLWYQEPFAELYWQGEVPPDLSKPIKCANPRCNEWFELPAEAPGEFGDYSPELQAARARWRRRHCSEACALMDRRIRLGETYGPGEEERRFECEFCGEEVGVLRKFGGGAAKSNRRACEKPECKRALRAALMRKYRQKVAA